MTKPVESQAVVRTPRWVWFAIAVAVIAAAAGIIAVLMLRLNSSPVSAILLPTLDVRRGVPHIAEFGMRKSEVDRVLGEPIIDVPPLGPGYETGDSEPRTFYDGALLWVVFLEDLKVSSVYYDLRENEEFTGREQRVAVLVDTKVATLSSRDTLAAAVQKLEAAGLKRRPGEERAMFEGVGLSLFDHQGRLSDVYLNPPDP